MSGTNGAEPGGTSSGTPRGTTRYSVLQMARLLNISERAVRKQIATGKLLAERDGNRWWIVLAEPPPEPAGEPEPELRGTERGTEPEPDAEPIDVDYRPEPIEAGRRYLEELRDEWLMPLVRENGDLREELGAEHERRRQAEVERDQLRTELEQLKATQGVPGGHQESTRRAVDEPQTSNDDDAAQEPTSSPWWAFWRP